MLVFLIRFGVKSLVTVRVINANSHTVPSHVSGNPFRDWQSLAEERMKINSDEFMILVSSTIGRSEFCKTSRHRINNHKYLLI